MASFSTDYPYAYHVIPLHLAKPIWRQGALWSKQRLAQEKPGFSYGRMTTASVDLALGLGNFIHLYLLPRHISDPFGALPILQTQLKESYSRPFPHLVLRVPTALLDDAACALCLWNAAVSRPGVPSANIKGGNWTRGTRPSSILEVWEKFRAENPDCRRRRGFWQEEVALPLLVGSEITENLNLLRLAPNGCPELLIREELPLHQPMTIHVFSEADADALALLGASPGGMAVHREHFPGYAPAQADEERVAIRQSFVDGDVHPIHLDYDRRR